MTDTSVQAALEDEYETELSRLGSSKALYALTEGEMEPEAVGGALAAWAAAAADQFEEWAEDDDRDVFGEAAGTARDLVDRIGDPDESNDSAGQVAEVLADQSDADARLGALLAWTMVTDRTLSQAVGFFVGNADPQGADRFRDLRTEVDGLREAALDRLDDADRQEALTAAEQVVEAAYDQYVKRLEGLGVKVKPVC